MSDTLNQEFIGRRLDSLQRDFADVRRRVIMQTEEYKLTEKQLSTTVERLDALVERVSGLESLHHRALYFLERWAEREGIPGPP